MNLSVWSWRTSVAELCKEMSLRVWWWLRSASDHCREKCCWLAQIDQWLAWWPPEPPRLPWMQTLCGAQRLHSDTWNKEHVEEISVQLSHFSGTFSSAFDSICIILNTEKKKTTVNSISLGLICLKYLQLFYPFYEHILDATKLDQWSIKFRARGHRFISRSIQYHP